MQHLDTHSYQSRNTERRLSAVMKWRLPRERRAAVFEDLAGWWFEPQYAPAVFGEYLTGVEKKKKSLCAA